MVRRARVIGVVALLALGLAGCGDSADPNGEAAAGGSSQQKFRQAALKFARCMREHGVDVPDPKQGERGFVITPDNDPSAGNRAAFERAQKACQRFLADVPAPEMSANEQREFRARALEHARCMRRHGIDLPDPRFGEGGRVALELPRGLRPDDPRFQRAEAACRAEGATLLPGGRSAP